MFEIFIAVFWFALTAGGANLLQRFYSYTYQKNWFVFVSLFLCVGYLGLFLTTSIGDNFPFLDITGLILAGAALAMFLGFEYWWGRSFTLDDMYKPETLPSAYQGLLVPQFASSVTKAVEIFFQDLVMLVIILQLLQNGFSYFVAGLIFMGVSTAVHLPGLYMFGRVYGAVFLVLSSAFAPFAPLVIGEIAVGFYVIFSFHLIMYPVIIMWSRWMRLRIN